MLLAGDFFFERQINNFIKMSTSNTRRVRNKPQRNKRWTKPSSTLQLRSHINNSRQTKIKEKKIQFKKPPVTKKPAITVERLHQKKLAKLTAKAKARNQKTRKTNDRERPKLPLQGS